MQGHARQLHKGHGVTTPVEWCDYRKHRNTQIHNNYSCIEEHVRMDCLFNLHPFEQTKAAIMDSH